MSRTARVALKLRQEEGRRAAPATLTPGVVIDARITEVLASGLVAATTGAGERLEARCPQHVSLGWLRAALQAGPVEAALVPSPGNRAPIVWGLFPAPAHDEAAAAGAEVVLRGRTVRVEAAQSVELACGPAQVTLRREGEVRTRGKDILSRASRSNRIKGGSVRIN